MNALLFASLLIIHGSDITTYRQSIQSSPPTPVVFTVMPLMFLWPVAIVPLLVLLVPLLVLLWILPMFSEITLIRLETAVVFIKIEIEETIFLTKPSQILACVKPAKQ
jgi:fatty acid desaturase